MPLKRLATLALTAALAAGFSTTPAVASDRTDVMATVNQFVDGFNKVDTKRMLATCDAQAAVIDDFPPHEWQGSAACSDWWNDFVAFCKAQGITDSIVTLGKAQHDDVTGARAYVVVPATYTFKQHGKRVVESGAVFTLALHKGADGWRIAGWAWADR
jgi:hypothetical protein